MNNNYITHEMNSNQSQGMSKRRKSNNCDSRGFDLKAFAELKEIKDEEDIKSDSDLFESPLNVAVLNDELHRIVRDDSSIKRITIGSSPFIDNQLSAKTTPRRPRNEKYYYCPSNTIVASDGDVYYLEPFMLPPPHQISAMMKELVDRRDRSDSLGSQLFFRSNKKVKTGVVAPLEEKSSVHWILPEIHERGNPTRRPGYNTPEKVGIVTSSKSLSKQKILEKCPPMRGKAVAQSARPEALESKENSSKKYYDEEYFHPEKFSLVNYLNKEFFAIGESRTDNDEAVHKISNFLSVPLMVEKLIFFGFFVCVDAFLYVLTILPVRVLYALILLVLDATRFLSRRFFNAKIGDRIFFNRTNGYDLMRGLFIIIGTCSLLLLNMSRVYHFIRGQNMIKLYVLTGMLEISDKLLGSFGQDSFESLYTKASSVKSLSWSSMWGRRLSEESSELGLISSFIVVALYVIIHSGVFFIHIATLTVAINSAEQALTSVLVMNNFTEIKSFVFKKFDRLSIFQLACKDITERFQIVLFLLLVFCVSLAQSECSWNETMQSHSSIIMAMLAAEALADSIKHAFLAKLNGLDFTLYSDMSRVLERDILNAYFDQKSSFDHTYATTRRVGLSQIPLACVAIRYLALAWDSPVFQENVLTLSNTTIMLYTFHIFLCLLFAQVLVSVGLIFYAGRIHNKELNARILAAKSAKVDVQKESMVQSMMEIERYSVYKGRIVG